ESVQGVSPSKPKTSRVSREATYRQERIAQAAAGRIDLKIQERKPQPSVEAFVAAGHASDFKQSPDDDQSTLCDHVVSALKEDIEDTLTQISRVYTDLGQIFIYATEHYITKIMAEHSDIEHYEQRKRAFQAVLRIATTFEVDFGGAAQRVLERVRKLLDGTVHMHVIEEVGRRTSDAIRTQAQHFIMTPKSQVMDQAPEWANTIGKPMLDAIDKKDNSERDDLLSINWLLNTVLPED
ncbi:hypothetical protein BGW38_009146, partial [Lunasporangiospora selenospora]